MFNSKRESAKGYVFTHVNGKYHLYLNDKFVMSFDTLEQLQSYIRSN